jgi:hypothetical protein
MGFFIFEQAANPFAGEVRKWKNKAEGIGFLLSPTLSESARIILFHIHTSCYEKLIKPDRKALGFVDSPLSESAKIILSSSDDTNQTFLYSFLTATFPTFFSFSCIYTATQGNSLFLPEPNRKTI